MVLTGLVLAFVLWAGVQYLQKRASGLDTGSGSGIGSGTEAPTDNSTIPAPIAGQFDHSPAGILSATQTGLQFLLMGTGVSGAGISLQSKRNEIARTKVNASGEWQLGFSYDLQNEPSALDVLMVTPDGHQIRSDQSLFIIPNPHALSTAEEDTIMSSDGSDARKALLLLTAPGANSRVLQTPYDGLPQEDGFSIEVIDYDNSGGVIFSGSANRHGKVRIYAGDNLVGESYVDSDGRWSLIFGNIMPLGEYKISAELVVDETSASRLTLPFARMRPLFELENSPKILVQSLDDRIQIGRALFGGGYQYSVVYAPEALTEN